MSLLDFANQTLFQPMDFQNQEWMHEDSAGIDNGAFGLRLRPVDMQKFGILYLNDGCWNGKQLLSKKWIETSFTPWIKSKPILKDNDYGWYWWHYNWGPGWSAHIASGWKGQRIAVFPEQKIVLTVTAMTEDGTEDKMFGDIFNKFIIPMTKIPKPAIDLSQAKLKLRQEISAVQMGPSRILPSTERRMIPTSSLKEKHHPFQQNQ
jgi:CubicO group peptidase (beta-lactamase class C family)